MPGKAKSWKKKFKCILFLAEKKQKPVIKLLSDENALKTLAESDKGSWFNQESLILV